MTGVTRVVFDCNVLLQALASPNGPAGKSFSSVEKGLATLYVSAALLEEVRDVLARPRVQAKLKITDLQAAAFIDALLAVAVFVEAVPQVWSYDRDPKDALYVNLALAAGARLVVTRDLDLLDLMKDDNADGYALRTAHPGFAVLTPSEFLDRLRAN